MAITVMKRVEMKYLLSQRQYEAFLPGLKEHMALDQYGITTIQSLYYDTNYNYLVRKSLEKPPFKEKVRLRSYGLNDDNRDVYLELKRKAKGIVYKRRVALKEDEAFLFFLYDYDLDDTQIGREITYFRNFYKELSPKMLILYEREAYYEPDGGDLRLTFDHNIRYRKRDLNLHTSLDGHLILDEPYVLMEIKVQQAVPLWLLKLMSQNQIRQTSFSKYGAAYEKLLQKPGKEYQVWKSSTVCSANL